MAGSNMDDARVRSLPLSSNMLAILGSLLSAIDRRVAGFKEAQLWGNIVEDPKLGAMTCDMCCGTGFVLVEVETGTMTDHVDGNMKSRRAQKGPAGGSMDPAPGYPPSPEIPMSDEMCSFLNVKQAPASGTLGPSVSGISVATPTAASTAGHAVTVTSFPPASSSFTPFSPTDPGSSSDSSPSTATVPSDPVPHSSADSAGPPPTLSSAVPSLDVSAPVAASGTNAPNDGPFVLPPPSVVIPGVHSLGLLHPVPKPEDAVFCTEADGPPFYTVTHGKRVGCFGGWDMVAPYVVKAAGVAYGKKPSLAAAYEAYAKAYERPGAIQYI